MADVHAIKIADRRNATARKIGLAEGIMKDQQRFGVYKLLAAGC
jgi:hypothetical protein